MPHPSADPRSALGQGGPGRPFPQRGKARGLPALPPHRASSPLSPGGPRLTLCGHRGLHPCLLLPPPSCPKASALPQRGEEEEEPPPPPPPPPAAVPAPPLGARPGREHPVPCRRPRWSPAPLPPAPPCCARCGRPGPGAASLPFLCAGAGGGGAVCVCGAGALGSR